MAVPSTTEFLVRFPEFGEQTTSVVDGALAEAGRVTPEAVWRTLHTDGVGYLAAHLLAGRSMQIGIQVGSPSGNPSGQQLNATLYGQEYLRLRDSLPLCGFAI
jgi:hypothetical protein